MEEMRFLNIMEEILNLEESLNMETVLGKLDEWDSLSALMFQSEMSKHVKKNITPTEVRKAKTIGDLYALIN